MRGKERRSFIYVSHADTSMGLWDEGGTEREAKTDEEKRDRRPTGLILMDGGEGCRKGKYSRGGSVYSVQVTGLMSRGELKKERGSILTSIPIQTLPPSPSNLYFLARSPS